MMKKILSLLFLLSAFVGKAQMYFPPINNASTWDTISPQSLGWCTNKIPDLYNMLEEKKTKAFIVLKDGKIVMEKYFGTFTIDSSWYWASAGKSLVGFMVGQAQEKGLLSIEDSSSKYLGQGFTSCPPEKEGLIKIKHQLTMTTGLDEKVPDLDCTTPSCLNYKSDAGTRWYYHNAPYKLLQTVVANASGITFQQFTNQNVSARTGMYGLWVNETFVSKPRNMARFGLLILNKGIWGTDTLLKDRSYFTSMTNTSQNLNQSYGYLWWLNGKQSFMLPGTSFVFAGGIIPTAPSDMIAALGKNDQKIYVVPSKNLVVIRMGEDGNNNENDVPIQIDTMIWNKLNEVMCANNTSIADITTSSMSVYPNPFTDEITLDLSATESTEPIQIFNHIGQLVMTRNVIGSDKNITINLADLKTDIYFIKHGNYQTKVVKY
ncbi:MAG: serine hydrolase [Bacteroidota bacterium]